MAEDGSRLHSVPDGGVTDELAQLFSSRVRAAVLTHVLPRPHLRFSLTELSRLLDLPISSLQHECYKLERLGVLRGRREGASRRYRVAAEFPLLRPLTALVVAAIGPERALRAAIEGVSQLEAAFLARPLPLGATTVTALGSPVPLVLIGELPLEEIDAVQERATAVLGLPSGVIEAVFYRPADWRSRLTHGSVFAVRLVSGERIDLAGDPLLGLATAEPAAAPG